MTDFDGVGTTLHGVPPGAPLTSAATSQSNSQLTTHNSRVRIFDTTLRDGEQSPGASLNADEKLEIARQLARLGVDVIEAGFPISSPDDFEAVRRIAREVKGPIIAGLARARPEDIDRCWEAVRE